MIQHPDSPPQKRLRARNFTFSKFKFVAIFQSLYADNNFSPTSSLPSPPPPTSLTTHSLSQDTDFSSQYLSRHRFDLPSSSSSFGAGAYMSTSSSQSLAAGANFDPNSAGTNLIVNYLPQDMTDRELYSLFRHSGPIESCRVMRDFKVSSFRCNGTAHYTKVTMCFSIYCQMRQLFY